MLRASSPSLTTQPCFHPFQSGSTASDARCCRGAKQKKFYQNLDIHCTAMYWLGMKLQKELVAASSVPMVLSILTEGDNYGYAIIQRVKELSGGGIQWTDGMLYPVLHWMEDQDLVR